MTTNLWPVGTVVRAKADNERGEIVEVDARCPNGYVYSVYFDDEGEMWMQSDELEFVGPPTNESFDEDEKDDLYECMSFVFNGNYVSTTKHIAVDVDCGGDALYLDVVLDRFAEFLRASGYTYVQSLTAVKG